MPKKKRQFKDTSKPKKHYDRKVIHSRTGRQLSLTKVIPKDWLYVRIEPSQVDDAFIILRLTKLMGINDIAQATQTHKTNKQNTQ